MTTRPHAALRKGTARRHLRPSDARAAAQLASHATQGVIDITEGVHQSVRRRLGLPGGATDERTGGLTGQIYRAVRGVALLVGRASDATLAALLPLLDDPATHPEASPQREAVLAAINGVLGDKLKATGNPLAQTMELRLGGAALEGDKAAWTHRLRTTQGPATPAHLLLLVHGLCMNDTQWRRDGHDHGACLAHALGCTPVYLRYNSGLPIAHNGRELAGLLERLMSAWPVPLERITIVGHSMGGLVARSAVHAACADKLQWVAMLRELIFLGTPHLGAPLERAGHGVDLLLGATPFTAPFARLGQLRSAGITDLRHGTVAPHGHHHAASACPEGVACFAVAATLAAKRGLLADRLTGDGLVPLDSALGRHDDPARRLGIPLSHQHVVHRTGHLELLSSADVAARMLAWLR